MSDSESTAHNLTTTESTTDAPRTSGVAWLSIDEAADVLGVSRARVKRLLEDRSLGSSLIDGKRSIPEVFIRDGEPVQHLRGTLIALHDAGYDDEEACAWMLAVNDVVGTEPITALRQSRKTVVRQAIQFLAF